MVSAPFKQERRPFIVLFPEAAGAGVGSWPGQEDDRTLITGLAPSRDATAGEPVPLAKGYASCGTDSDHDGTGYPADPSRVALDDEMFENCAYAAYMKVKEVAAVLMQRHVTSVAPKAGAWGWCWRSASRTTSMTSCLWSLSFNGAACSAASCASCGYP